MLSSAKKFFIKYWSGYLVCIGLFLYISKREDPKNAEKVIAIVIDRLENTSGRTHYYYPQFQFTYNDSVYISADKLYWTREKKIGSELKVIFPKGQPEEAVIYTFVSYWIILPQILISFMIAFFIFAMIGFFKWKNGWSFFENQRSG